MSQPQTTEDTSRENLLGTAPIGRLLFSLAVPAITAQVVNMLYNIVDRIYIGHIPEIGTAALTGVGITFPIITLISAFSSLIAMGGAPRASIAMGAHHKDRAERIMGNCLTALLAISVVLTAVFLLFQEPVLWAFGASENTIGYAMDYMGIYVCGTVFVQISLGMNMFITSQGFAKTSMLTVIIGAVLNIALDPLFIFAFGMGVRGAAIATVLGTVCACGMSIASVLRKDSFINLRSVKGWLPERQSINSIGNVWSSSLVEQVCLRIGFLLFSMTVAHLGTTELASHQIGMNMMSMSFSFGDGLSVASVTLIGQSLGKARPDMAKIYGNVCQKIGFLCACVMGSVYFFFGKDVFLLYTTDPVILDYGAMIMRILSIILFMQIEQVTLFGCLRGAGDTRFTALVSLISVTFIRPGMSWLLCYPLGLGLMGAWLGTACDQFVRFVLTFIRFRKGKWMKLKL